MTVKSMVQAQEWAQLPLLLLSLGFAYYLPLEGVLLSYAILGPAHYLTQIHWLHRRDYFIPDVRARFLFGVVALGCCGAAALLFANSELYGMVLLFALLTAIGLILPALQQRIILLLLAAAIIAVALMQLPMTITFAAVLLPTVIHVGLFTLTFLIAGARKRRDSVGYWSVWLWLGCIGIILIIPPAGKLLWPNWFMQNSYIFENILPLSIFGSSGAGIEVLAKSFSLLTFMYTYHYLNWFSKTEVLKWHVISKPMLIVLVGIYAASLALYFYDYQLGLKVLLVLSLLHVVLEFPLNVRTISSFFTFLRPASER